MRWTSMIYDDRLFSYCEENKHKDHEDENGRCLETNDKY